jgi:hypothetical protein
MMQLVKTNNMIMFIVAFFLFILIGYQHNLQGQISEKILPSVFEDTQPDLKISTTYCPIKESN